MRYLITLVAFIIFSVFTYSQTRTYTLDADFDEGTLVNVNHDIPDQLQLSTENVILPCSWVPRQQGYLSKTKTETGKELGRYRVAPHSCFPSRTTVDLDGNCWVGNRQAGTVVKIGLYEAGHYIDRNGNGTIETSLDLNDDGNITGAEILPWGQDECVLFEVVLITGKEGTFVPDTYVGGYDYNHWGTSPRGLAIDASNNLWAGTWISSKYYYIDGSSGAILRTVDVSSLNHHAYGAVIDNNGILWSSGQAYNHVLRLDPSTPPTISTLDIGHFVYGLGIDYLNHIFISGWTTSSLSRVNYSTGVKEWTKSGPYEARGVACTSDGDVWIAATSLDKVYRYNNDGNIVTSIDVGDGPTGVAVDAAGKVWVCNLNDEYIKRIDPATNTIDLSKEIVGSGGHYSYSDMTGIIAKTITTKIGTWNVVYDSGIDGLPWGTISWNDLTPEGTSVIVEVRSSIDGVTWSSWETTTNEVLLSSTPDGRYLEVKVTLQIISGDVSPILYDLTIQSVVQFVAFDIKPQSCPNPLNVKDKGTIPVAILGTADFDVMNIDPVSLLFEGVAPIRWAVEDEATPVAGEQCDCTTEGPDGFDDLTLKFDAQEVVAAIGLVNNGDELVLTITGNLLDGTPIEGSDCVIIKSKDKLGKQLVSNSSNVPEEYALFENYPNPFNPSTTIKFALPEQSFIKLDVYNSLGQKVTTLVSEELVAGTYSFNWDATKLPSGVYIYNIQTKNFVDVKKMMLIK